MTVASHMILSPTSQPIERKPRKFNPVEIPAKLQQLLPFKSKPKDTAKQKKAPVENRVPVIMQPSEKKTHAAIQQLRLIKHEKAMPQSHSSQLYCQPLFCLFLMISLYPRRQRRRKLRNNRRKKHTRQRKPRPSY
jgi:ribosome biogenesis protein BMS1